jgi:hypothetical protein
MKHITRVMTIVISIIALTLWPIGTFAQAATQLFMVWNGSKWIAVTGTLTGDVTGPVNANTVGAIHGVPVSATNPTTGQVLVYNGTQYAPATITASLIASGTITLTANGTLTSQSHPFSPALAAAPSCTATPLFNPATLPSPYWWASPATTTGFTVNLDVAPTTGTYVWSFTCGPPSLN